MSAAEELVPPAPELLEEQRHRMEDPGFAVIHARARARARGEPYNPELHGPFDVVRKPKRGAEIVEASTGNLQELIARFMEKGKARQQGVRDIRDWRDR